MRLCNKRTALCGLLITTLVWAFPMVLGAEGVLYLKNNVHAQAGTRDIKASYANWTNPGDSHMIIPVNTPIVLGSFQRGFSFTIQDSGKKVIFEFDKKRMGMDKDAYIRLITSPTKISLKGLSDLDQKGIKDGKAYVGMTKEGVRMALGYPAAHRTPSLDANKWVYWTNRFVTRVIEFDGSGKVISAP